MTLEQAQPEVQRKFMAGVYWRMTLALFLTAAVAWYSAQSQQILGILYSHRGLPFYGLIVAELVLVIALSAFIHKMNSFVALLFFILYSAVNGLTFSSIFIVYQLGSVYHIFLVSALSPSFML